MTTTTILLIALSIVGITLCYQILKFATRVVKFITRPWRPLDVPEDVTFELENSGNLKKVVRLYFKGVYRHMNPISYEGDPVRNMRKAQRTLLRRFKATNMCQKVEQTT